MFLCNLLLGKIPKVEPPGGTWFRRPSRRYRLVDPIVLQNIISVIKPKSSDSVLHVGCGCGELTCEISVSMKNSGSIYAIEKSSAMCNDLHGRLQELGIKNVVVVNSEYEHAKLPPFNLAISTLPSSLVPKFLFLLANQRPMWQNAFILAQRGLAERILADPASRFFSRLSLQSRVYFQAERIMKISGGAFSPFSNSSMLLLRLTPRIPPPLVDFGEWNAMLVICFSKRREKLGIIFSSSGVLARLESAYKSRCTMLRTKVTLISFKDYVATTLEECNLHRKCAIRTDYEDFMKLLHEFHKRGIYFSNITQRGNDDYHYE